MQIVNIELENFKSIGHRQKLNLRPITLLFGNNSVGKSTIIQGIHYFREIIERKNVNPDLTLTGGALDLGGFSTLVHNHDLEQKIRIKLVIDVSDDLPDFEFLPLNRTHTLRRPEFADLQIMYLVGESYEYIGDGVVYGIGLELEVSWSSVESAPYVSKIISEINGTEVIAVESPSPSENGYLSTINFNHPLLKDAILESEPNTDTFENPNTVSVFEQKMREMLQKISSTQLLTENLKIPIFTEIGALPKISNEFGLMFVEPELFQNADEQSGEESSGLSQFLSELVIGPLIATSRFLSETTYIGPLRDIPSRNFRSQIIVDEARWSHGLAAWDLLYNDKDRKLIESVNSWISDTERLNTQYEIERIGVKEIPISSRIDKLLTSKDSNVDLADIFIEYSKLPERVDVLLRELGNGTLVEPSDVGVGITQLLPVVVALLHKNSGLLAIEQPELHVHPALQAKLGDLFIWATNRNLESRIKARSLLIETHSEHLILRLLRRIRETNEKTNKEGIELYPDDLSVVYVGGTNGETKLHMLDVDKEGEFLQQWPDGFFEERAEELF